LGFGQLVARLAVISVLLIQGIRFEELLDTVEEVYWEGLDLGVGEHGHILLNVEVLLKLIIKIKNALQG
jgi:hypothetical protein